jgi:hypothetical protein
MSSMMRKNANTMTPNYKENPLGYAVFANCLLAELIKNAEAKGLYNLECTEKEKKWLKHLKGVTKEMYDGLVVVDSYE